LVDIWCLIKIKISPVAQAYHCHFDHNPLLWRELITVILIIIPRCGAHHCRVDRSSHRGISIVPRVVCWPQLPLCHLCNSRRVLTQAQVASYTQVFICNFIKVRGCQYTSSFIWVWLCHCVCCSTTTFACVFLFLRYVAFFYVELSMWVLA